MRSNKIFFEETNKATVGNIGKITVYARNKVICESLAGVMHRLRLPILHGEKASLPSKQPVYTGHNIIFKP